VRTDIPRGSMSAACPHSRTESSVPVETIGALMRGTQTTTTSVRLRGKRGAGGIMKTWLTVADAAEYSGLSRDTIYTACERGELRHARIGGRRAIRLKPEWIDEWIERHARGAQEGRSAPAGSTQSAVS
jgi:excisionase family DNA binding protein